MAIDRRCLLLGAPLVLAATAAARSSEQREERLLGAASRAADGSFGASILDSEGRAIREVILPGRGHDLTYCPVNRIAVVFARRPGSFAVSLSIDGRQPDRVFHAPEGRHFYGHGVFSPDGALLYATENDFETARGVIGIYDVAAGFLRIGEWSTHGLGPHDLALIPQQGCLVVANGGHREHPDFGGGRRILNPGSFETSLVFLDLKTGDLRERHLVASAGRISLRHLDTGGRGLVILGAQAMEDPEAPLLFTGRLGKTIRPLSLFGAQRALGGYVSSVAMDADGRWAAVTSSRTGQALVIDLDRQTIVSQRQIDDISGIASGPAVDGFVYSSGHGWIGSLSSTAGLPRRQFPREWDNHLIAFSIER
ncbi:DUF1513 domain-containing protein [Rhabdaerophilum sp. SD176]|uniref:DUF1513 domain-containing protein n=1 Tax=Rhabdaerophilum sp. SD176 TaxID=2983548 RepID=UPI0024E00A1E|nr:DUF1513 domain-containing protein [Rhabdaerophilum sp. SD176]